MFIKRVFLSFSLLLFYEDFVFANNTHHIFTSYTFQEAELVGDVDSEEFDKAWNSYNFTWTPLELIKPVDEQTYDRVLLTNCREVESYAEKRWYPYGIRYINLAGSYDSVCSTLGLLAKTKPLASDVERKRLRVISNFDKIVLRTLPYYWTPFEEYFPEKLEENATIGQLIEKGQIKYEKRDEHIIKLSFDSTEILIIEFASARFFESSQIKTLVVIGVSDRGAVRFQFPQLVSMDPETGLMYCEDFE